MWLRVYAWAGAGGGGAADGKYRSTWKGSKRIGWDALRVAVAQRMAESGPKSSSHHPSSKRKPSLGDLASS